MKNLKILFILSLITVFVFSCKKNSTPEIKIVETETIKKLNPNATYAKTEFTIEGMTCAVGCAAAIQKKISNMDGVKLALVDFEKKLAMVEYDVDKVTYKSLEETVAKVSKTYKILDMKTVKNFSTQTSQK